MINKPEHCNFYLYRAWQCMTGTTRHQQHPDSTSGIQTFQCTSHIKKKKKEWRQWKYLRQLKEVVPSEYPGETDVHEEHLEQGVQAAALAKVVQSNSCCRGEKGEVRPGDWYRKKK